MFMVLSLCYVLFGCATFDRIARPTSESLGEDVAGMLGVRPGQVQVTNIESKNNIRMGSE